MWSALVSFLTTGVMSLASKVFITSLIFALFSVFLKYFPNMFFYIASFFVDLLGQIIALILPNNFQISLTPTINYFIVKSSIVDALFFLLSVYGAKIVMKAMKIL